MVVKFGGKGINVMEKKGTPPNKDLAMSQPLHYKYSSKFIKYQKSSTFFLNIMYFNNS